MLSLLDRVPHSWIRRARALRGDSPWVKSVTDWVPAMMRNQEGRIQKGLGRGLRFNGGDSNVGFLLGTHDFDVQYAMDRLLQPGMVAYDIGANVGFTAVLAAKKVAPGGRVVCFEPLAINAEKIQHNAALNGFGFVQVHEIALGAADGEAEFHLSESPTWGRLANSGPAPLQSGVVRVPVRTLDSLLERDGLPPPQLIKMDVEGGEADVLRGARKLLATARPILIIELHHTYDAVVAALQGLDYEVRPLTEMGKELSSLQDEFQLLVYPRERRDAEAVCADLAAGKTVAS